MRLGAPLLRVGNHPTPPVVSVDGRRARATVMVPKFSHLQINILKWPMCKGAGPAEAIEATAFYVCRSHRNGAKEARAAGEFTTHPPGSLAPAGDSCAQPQWTSRRDFLSAQHSERCHSGGGLKIIRHPDQTGCAKNHGDSTALRCRHYCRKKVCASRGTHHQNYFQVRFLTGKKVPDRKKSNLPGFPVRAGATVTPIARRLRG